MVSRKKFSLSILFLSYVQPEKKSNDLWTQKASLRSRSEENVYVKEAWSSSTHSSHLGDIPGANIQHPSLGKSVIAPKPEPPGINNLNHIDTKLETLEEARSEDEAGDMNQEEQKEPTMLKQGINEPNLNGLVMQEAA